MSPEDGVICKMSVLADLANDGSTRIKQKIRILDYPKNLIKVFHARLVIAQGLTWKKITTGSNQYCFTKTFIDGEALHIFDLKSTELRHKTVANLIIMMNSVLTYSSPKECLSKKK